MNKRLILIILLITFISGSWAAGNNFRFAWLTDTHVGSTTGADDLRASVDDINNMDDIDFVILSGDISELDIDGNLDTAKMILDRLEIPYYIIPGNHDTKWSASGHTKFKKLWGSDKFNFEHKGIRFIGIHQGPLMKMGAGYIPPEDLRWVDSVLVNLEDPDQPIFFVTHYGIDSSVSNWFRLLDFIKRYNTQAILHGHGHNNRVFNYEDITGVMGRSNLRAGAEQGGYTIAEIAADSIRFFERITGKETLPNWFAAAMKTRVYSVDPAVYERLDFSVNQQYSQVREIWRVNTNYAITASPAVHKNRVFTANSGGNIQAFSCKDGKSLWKYWAGAAVFSTPVATNGSIVFGSVDSNIYCLNDKNGFLLWKFHTGAAIVACPAIEKNIVYIGGSDGIFRALSLKTGSLIWEFRGVTGFVETRPLITPRAVIFGAWDGNLYSLDKKTGVLNWKWADGRPGVLYSPAACWPVATMKYIYVVAPDRFLSCIDLETGKSVWRTNDHMVRETIGISEDGSRVYARCMQDSVIALAADLEIPQIVWKVSAEYGYDIDPSMPVEEDGVVFFGTNDGFIFALSAETGVVLWKHRIDVGLINTVVPLSKDRVVVTTMDGIVALLEHRK